MSSSSQWRAFKQWKKHKQMIMKEDNSNSLFLPEEIIRNILKGLPAKSLIRFQCVSKLWKTLLKTHSFIHEHLHHSTMQNPYLLLALSFPLNSSELYLLNKDMKVVELHSSNVIVGPRIIGSANGLLCLQHNFNLSHPFFLWNPAIRDVRPVPKPVGLGSFCFNPYWVGFGYCSIVNDYNILTIDFCGRGMQILSVRVYSSKTWSWKKVESSLLTEIISISNQNSAVNGNIFCVGTKKDVNMNTKDVLVSYDMALEVFTVIPLPSSPVNTRFTCLAIHENKVAILYHALNENLTCCLIDMWVMEDGICEAKERCIWTKKFSVSHPFLSIGLAIWRNKMIYLSCYTHATQGEELEENNIYMIDLTTSEVNTYDNFIFHMPNPFLNYVESIVPVSNNHIEEF